MLFRVRRECSYVLGESIATFAPLERLGRDVLSILFVGKEPAKERLAVPRRAAKLDTEQAILIRSDLKTRRFDSRMNSELLNDAPGVGTDRVRGNAQLCCYRPGVRALGREKQHLGLLWRELLMSWVAFHRLTRH